jgi:hypothetical protein
MRNVREREWNNYILVLFTEKKLRFSFAKLRNLYRILWVIFLKYIKNIANAIKKMFFLNFRNILTSRISMSELCQKILRTLWTILSLKKEVLRNADIVFLRNGWTCILQKLNLYRMNDYDYNCILSFRKLISICLVYEIKGNFIFFFISLGEG